MNCGSIRNSYPFRGNGPEPLIERTKNRDPIASLSCRRDISKLINESAKRVSQGSEISKEAANSFQVIVDGVAKTTSAISEISLAAEEQQTASRDVAQAIQQVADSTEESAVASESIAKATSELATGSEKLKAVVQKFAD